MFKTQNYILVNPTLIHIYLYDYRKLRIYTKKILTFYMKYVINHEMWEYKSI